jgi:hypothetical protein
MSAGLFHWQYGLFNHLTHSVALEYTLSISSFQDHLNLLFHVLRLHISFWRFQSGKDDLAQPDRHLFS